MNPDSCFYAFICASNSLLPRASQGHTWKSLEGPVPHPSLSCRMKTAVLQRDELGHRHLGVLEEFHNFRKTMLYDPRQGSFIGMFCNPFQMRFAQMIGNEFIITMD
jgi:hypothetical protein